MAKLRNRITIVLSDKDFVCLRVKNEAEAKQIIKLIYKHKGKLIIQTSQESCPTIINCNLITKAIYLEGELSEDTVGDVLKNK